MLTSVKLFVSSTFLDMQRERDILSRIVVPRIRVSMENKITVREIDLRWGVTRTMAKNEGAVGLCLEEVANSVPAVLGLVGHRVGWKPTLRTLHADFSAVLGKQCKGLGLTELELLLASKLAALSNQSGPLLFLRAPALSARALQELNSSDASILEEPSSEIQGLRNRLREMPNISVHQYDTYDEFEALALRHLPALIEQAATSQRSRCRPRSIEIPRNAEIQRIRAAMARRPTLLTAAPGAGVTWVVSRLPHERRPASVFQIDGRRTAVDDAPRALDSSRFSSRFQLLDAIMESPSHSTILFDHFEDAFPTTDAVDLSILPSRLGSNRRLLVSTRNSKAIEQAKALKWEIVELRPIKAREATNYISRYLRAFGKRLTRHQLSTLVSARWINNIGSLLLASDELRRHGSFESLDTRIGQLASINSDKALAADVLDGVKSVLPAQFRDGIDCILDALFLSVRGLEEDFLRRIGGTDVEMLPTSYWSALNLALPSAFTRDGARVDLSRGPITALLEDIHSRAPARPRLASERSLAHIGELDEARQLIERPGFTWISGGDGRLADLLMDTTFVVRLATLAPNYAASWLDRFSRPLSRAVVQSWIDQAQSSLSSGQLDGLKSLAEVAARAGHLDLAANLLSKAVSRGPVSAEHDATLAFLTGDIGMATLIIERLTANGRSGPAEPQDLSLVLFALGLVAEGKIALNDEQTSAVYRFSADAHGRRLNYSAAAQLSLYVGQLLVRSDRARHAIPELERAVRLARGAGNARLLCSALERLSSTSLDRNRFRAAVAAGEECRALSESLGLIEFESLAFERLVECYVRTAAWEAAYATAEAFLKRAELGIAPVERARICLNSIEAA